MPVLIDGYNLLRFIQNSDEEFQRLDEAALCRILSRYLKGIRDHGHIVFDGIGPPDKTDLGGIRGLEVYFSGPNIEADEIIEEKISDNTAPRRLTVVSSDRRIRAAAAKRKAVAVKSDIFWDMLIRQLDKGKRKPSVEPREKHNGITESETDQWLNIFGIDEE